MERYQPPLLVVARPTNSSDPIELIDGWKLTWVTAIVCAVSPTILASVWYRFRKSGWAHQKLGLDHPTPRGWEFFLTQAGCFFVLFHLKNGKMVGGFYGPKSYASTYPQEPEIYVQEVWRVDETGAFVQKVTDSLGLVIRQSEWERIEFLSPYGEEANSVGLHQQTEGTSGIAPQDAVGGATGEGPPGTECDKRPQDRTTTGGIGNSTPEKSTT